jgi:O-antigen/teichoic acid export membrane protein
MASPAPLISEPVSVPAATIPSLRRNFAWTFAGNIVYALCQWGMLAILAKLGSPAVVGQFALGLALSAPVFMFTNLQLRGVQATDATGEYAFSTYFTLRCMCTVIALALIFVLTVLGPYDRTTAAVVMLVALAKAIETLSDVVAGLLQRMERLSQVARALMLRGSVSLAGFSGVYAFTRSLLFAVAALALCWTSVYLTYELRCARAVMATSPRFFSWQPRSMWKLILLSLPLGVVMALISLNVNIPRYVLERHLGAAELGIFASLAYLVTAANLIISALGQSACTRLATMFARRQFRAFKRLVGRLVVIGTSLFILGVPIAMLAGRTILTVLYRPEYGDHVRVLVIMVVTSAIAAAGSFLGYSLTAARCLRVQMPITIAAAFVVLSLSFLLIPRHGLQGAAFALLGGAVVVTLTSAVALAAAVRTAERSA